VILTGSLSKQKTVWHQKNIFKEDFEVKEEDCEEIF